MFDIHQNFVVNASSQKVFEAFCSPQSLDSWRTLHSAGKPQTGNTYTFYFGPGYDWRVKVIHLLPGYELTWEMFKTMDE